MEISIQGTYGLRTTMILSSLTGAGGLGVSRLMMLLHLAINYIFFSLKNHGDVRGAYRQGLELFFKEYIRASADEEITKVVAPFFAFRAAVVANPIFYPELSPEAREKIFLFADSVLSSDTFSVEMLDMLN